MQQAKPFLRWAGSKRQLLKQLESYWDSSRRLVEPFCGSASLFFHLAPKTAILNDLNSEVGNAFSCVKRIPMKVFEAYSKWGCSEADYYSIRALDPLKMNPPDRAARFIYLMRFCYGGVYRTNKNGIFNVPYGHKSTGKLPSRDALAEASKALSSAEITTCDYRVFIEDNVTRDDFVYLDPPYYGSSHDYSINQPSNDDIIGILRYLDTAGALFVLSCTDIACVERAKDHGWFVDNVSVRRNIASSPAKRMCATEYLIANCEKGVSHRCCELQ